MNARRGYVPEDDRNFSAEALKKMRKAAANLVYLLNEGYELKPSTVFVGNHFLFSKRQRLALMRTVASDRQVSERTGKRKKMDCLHRETVWIDGFNEIITLEVMLSHSPLFLARDGAIRDLAALRGTYRLIPETDEAIRLMLQVLQNTGIGGAVILLDEPVSNSGRLKTRIAEIGEEYPVPLDIRVLRDVDRTLCGKENVISSDSVILDRCVSWINLTEACLSDSRELISF